jgi:hypothetical protein
MVTERAINFCPTKKRRYKMRFCMTILVLGTTLFVLLSSAQEERDPYSMSLVRFELQMRSGGTTAIHSFSQKQLVRLGDAVSVALIKILDDHEMLDTKNLRVVLPMIRDAFSQPASITIDANRKAQVTLLLLDHIRQGVNDSQTLADVEGTATFVREHTTKIP